MLTNVILPTLRRVSPSLIADLIVSVQPMKAPTDVFFKILKNRKSHYKQQPQPSNRSFRARSKRRLIAIRTDISFRSNAIPAKGRRGLPHWREFQMFPYLYEHAVTTNNLVNAFMHRDNLYENQYANRYSQLFWDWLSIEMKSIGARIAYDLLYDNKAIRFPDEETKIVFMLKWGGAQP
jgi:hypothetical protein